jgi:hypothetical protein
MSRSPLTKNISGIFDIPKKPSGLAPIRRADIPPYKIYKNHAGPIGGGTQGRLISTAHRHL